MPVNLASDHAVPGKSIAGAQYSNVGVCLAAISAELFNQQLNRASLHLHRKISALPTGQPGACNLRATGSGVKPDR